MGSEGHAPHGLSAWLASGEGAHRLSRIGVIDIGSNSVRLVVFDRMERSPSYLYNEKVLCGLGTGLHESRRLSPEGRQRAMGALRRFVALADRMELSRLVAVATAAVREAEDGPDFCAEVSIELGLSVHVASGREEARLSAQGVLLGWPGADGLASDMGGSSMELARVAAGEVGACATAQLGPLHLADVADPDKRQRLIRKRLKALRREVPGRASRLFLVGGSWRAIARLDMERVGYPLKVLHGYQPPIPQLLATLAWIRQRDPSVLSAMAGTSGQRASLIPHASEVLAEIIRRLDPDRLVVSAYGLREGLLYREMPTAMRRQDPLIEACRQMEVSAARSPGFGEALHSWLRPLYPGCPPSEDRLILAACLLHDVNWRAHPDYRAELCFETATRGNIAGIDHAERVFLGLALLNRYKATAPAEELQRYGGLLTPERAQQAAVLGRAMRLGAMLSGAARGVLDHAAIGRDDDGLSLTLTGPGKAFAGEAVERRLAMLGGRLGIAHRLVLAD